MKRGKAIYCLAVVSVIWGGSVPWMIYLVFFRGFSKWLLITVVFYAWLYRWAFRVLWPHVSRKASRNSA